MTRATLPGTPSRTALHLRLVSLALGMLGATYYFLVLFGPDVMRVSDKFGEDIYDYYYLAILDGRLDIPVRVLRYEGHYLPDGTGFAYHGLSPLLTRFAFGWAVPLTDGTLARASIWLWTVLGTAAYHATFLLAAQRAWPRQHSPMLFWTTLLGVAVWFSSPGIVLTANTAVFHEPIAVTYAVCGIFILCWMRGFLQDQPLRWGLVVLALCAGLALHGRPNVAIGMYAGTLAAIALSVYQLRRAAVLPSLVSLGILGISGVLFLALNYLRFGSSIEVHGGFEETSTIYGTVFWGREDPYSVRAVSFSEHGRFNIHRILPNLGLYLFDLPERAPIKGLSELIMAAFRSATEDKVGFIRVESPRFGVAYMWSFWGVLFLYAAAVIRKVPKEVLLLFAAMLIAAGITAAYGTVTLRHRTDLWPAIAVLAAAGLMTAPTFTGSTKWARPIQVFLVCSVAVGVTGSVKVTSVYSDIFFEIEEFFFRLWTVEHCIELGREHTALTEARLAEVCAPPG